MNREPVYISGLQKRMFFLSFGAAFISAFTQSVAVLADNLIVCTWMGENEIAAKTLAGPFYYILEIFAAGLAVGLQVVCAESFGAGKLDRVNRLFDQVFLLAAASMSVLTVLSLAFAPQMTALWGHGRSADLCRAVYQRAFMGDRALCALLHHGAHRHHG